MFKNHLATWLNMDYNLGNHFDGSIFKAPFKGIYTFNVCAGHTSETNGHVELYVNESRTVNSQRNCNDDSYSNIWLHTTLRLETDDEISIRLHGDLYDLNDDECTFFEGTLISKLDE